MDHRDGVLQSPHFCLMKNWLAPATLIKHPTSSYSPDDKNLGTKQLCRESSSTVRLVSPKLFHLNSQLFKTATLEHILGPYNFVREQTAQWELSGLLWALPWALPWALSWALIWALSPRFSYHWQCQISWAPRCVPLWYLFSTHPSESRTTRVGYCIGVPAAARASPYSLPR